MLGATLGTMGTFASEGEKGQDDWEDEYGRGDGSWGDGRDVGDGITAGDDP